MNIFKTTVYAVIKRPFILILVGVLMLAAAVVNAFVPVIAMVLGIINMTGGNIFESMLSILQMLFDPGVIPTLLIALAVFTLFSAIAAGLLLPGFLLVVDDGIAEGVKKRGLFEEGLINCFFSFFLMTLKIVLSTVALALFLMVSAVPAIIVTRVALTTRPDLMVAALFIDFVTVGVLFMCLSFFRAYIYMWYIAASKGAEKPFRAGKAVADRQFWSITLNLLVFDLVFAAVIYLIYLSDSQIFRYSSGWAFATVFFTTLAVYLVQTFRDSSQNKRTLGDSSQNKSSEL